MKPKFVLTFASIMFFLWMLASFFEMVGEAFNFFAYQGILLTFCLAVLFWLARNAPPSKMLDAILLVGFLALFLGSLLAFYAQWSGNYMDSPLGYLEGVAWLAVAIWFFAVRRANMPAG